jgi:hypothetical protein
MSTLDEIANEKQRVMEALARVDAQREKLTGQLEELEATERVLARYSKGAQTRKTASAKTPTAAAKSAVSGRSRTATARAAGSKRSSSSLSVRSLPWQSARHSGKSLLHARALARMSAASLAGTSGLAASKSATGGSTPRSRRRRANAPRSDAG